MKIRTSFLAALAFTPGIVFGDEAGAVQTSSGMPAPEHMEKVLGQR